MQDTEVTKSLGLSLLLVPSFASRGFSPGTQVLPSPQKSAFPNCRNQMDKEPLCGCATSKSFLINLFFYGQKIS